MNKSNSLLAVLAYIPIIGWLYVLLAQRKNVQAMYHLRQSIGIFIFLAAVTIGWAIVAWVLAWIPYMAVLSMGLFALVVAAYIYGVIALITGIVNALLSKQSPLPLFGLWASHLPIR